MEGNASRSGSEESSNTLEVPGSLPPVVSKTGKSVCKIAGSIPHMENFIRFVTLVEDEELLDFILERTVCRGGQD